MNTINAQIQKMTSNPIGSIVGVGVGYWVSKNYIKPSQAWVTVLVSVLGGIAGANISSGMGRKGSPTATTVTSTTTK
jgi:outer membrane lipoprotein SlyB